MLKYFPHDPAVVAEIGRLLNELCQNDGEASRLTAAILQQCSEWPAPAKIREIHQSEVASRRPHEVEPRGCENCRDWRGWRYIFQVYDGMPNGSPPREVIFPQGNCMSAARQEDELRRKCAKSGVQVYSVLTPCDCALGQRRADDLKRAAAQRSGESG